MPKVKLDNINLYYEVCGKGAPLLLIAGLGSDSSSWLSVINDLSAYFRVIAFDNRGTGRSSVPDKPYTIRGMADDTAKLLNFLKIRRARVIGHSMGGYIAQELAINYPEYISKLVLESAASVSSERNNMLLNDFFKQLQSEENLKTWIRRWAFWLFSPKCFKNKTFIETFIKNASEYPYAQTKAGFKGQIGAIASFDTKKRLGGIKSKTLVVSGKEDILVLPEESEILAKNIPGSIFQSLKGAAHSIHIESPNLFVKAVLKFLNSK